MPTTIAWSAFWPTSTAGLPDDDDRIVATLTPRVLGVSGVRFQLARAPAITWWKGFCLVDRSGARIGGNDPVGTQDAAGAAVRDFSAAELARAVRLELWKAKFLGVHTHVYSLTDLSPLAVGTQVDLYWAQDSIGNRAAQFTVANFSGVKAQDNARRTFTVKAGARFRWQTRVVNNGSLAFDPRLNYRIGTQNPQDTGRWGTNRWECGYVVPGSGANVTLDLVAPAQPGTYPLAIRMVQDGVTWFGDTLTFTATVTAT